MQGLKEICSLVEKNKRLIVDLLKSEGYEYLFVFDEQLHFVFTEASPFVIIREGDIPKGKKGALLCLEKTEQAMSLETNVENIKCIVLETEYKRMFQQMEKIAEGCISSFAEMFGYTSIVCDGESSCIKKLAELVNREQKSKVSIGNNCLHITENIDTRNECEAKDTLGIRQFLFELEVFSTFPKEIMDKRNRAKEFEEFCCRFCSIYKNTGWKVVFSEKTPFVEMMLCQCNADNVYYLDDIVLDTEKLDKIMLIQNGNLIETEKFYQKYKSNHRLVVRRFIVLFRTWIMETLCAYFEEKLSEKGVSLYLVNWNWAMNECLFPRKQITSEDIEKREKYNLYNIKANISQYHTFLQKMYGEQYSEEYVRDIMDIPNKMELSYGKIRHENKYNQFIHVVNGERRTVGQPNISDNTIYMLGGCVFFGYAVEDRHTISSFLQKKINESKLPNDWKVVNMGTWGGNIDQTYKTLYDLHLRAGDIIVISYAGYMPLGEDYLQRDISTALNHPSISEEMYFNSVVHCNKIGYERVADKLYSMLKDEMQKQVDSSGDMFYLEESTQVITSQLYEEQAQEYLKQVKRNTPRDWGAGIYGAIVMNCNPFTLGHRYLIEESAKKVDYLYIFVVEEDKSFFKFKDRIQLVKYGTQDIPNVTVVPSGKLIISSVTFPGYFLKDSPDCVSVDTSLDVDIFARYIATPLHITKRFVGEEPLDIVTRGYNESMKEILPRYGIEVDEIPRKEKKGDVISASRVRKALKQGNFDSIEELVPRTTFEYLWKSREQYLYEEK